MKISKRKIGILVTIVLLFLIETISIASYSTNIELKDENIIISAEEIEVLNLINQYREENNLKKLKISTELQEVSKLKAEDLVKNNYFSHNSEDLGTPFEMLQNNNVDYKIAGENLAGNISAQNAVETWINSPSHKDNILEEKFE